MTYPATFSFDPPEKVANWRPLVQWLMAIPHFIIGYVINLVMFVCVVISWFAIVITGSMPKGLADVICMAHRYQGRLIAYAGFPAYIFFYIIYLVAGLLWFISFFAVLFTGKWPAGLLNFIQGAIRVGTRFSAYGTLLTDEYPPFEMN